MKTIIFGLRRKAYYFFQTYKKHTKHVWNFIPIYLFIYYQIKTQTLVILKRHWTTSASSPFFFSKKVEIFIPLEGYAYVINTRAFLFATSIQLQRYKDFSFVGHFKKSTSKNTNTVVYGTLWG